MNWKRIRKDAGEITIEDLREQPSWEFCLDEEGIEGQTECTIRPFKKVSATLSPKDSCLVACDFVAHCGQRLFGWITLGAGSGNHPWDLSPDILLPSFPTAILNDKHCNSIPFIVLTCPGTARINLALGSSRRFPESRVRPKLDLAYRALKMSASELFPITLEPRQAIAKWPNEYLIKGFLRPSDESPDLVVT